MIPATKGRHGALWFFWAGPLLREALLDAQYDLVAAKCFPVIILIAGVDGSGNRDSASHWEAFSVIDNGDGTISIRAKFNDQILTADGNHGNFLIPGRRVIQGWEKFTKADMGGGTFSLQSGLAGNPYVAVDAATGALIANSATPVAFKFTPL